MNTVLESFSNNFYIPSIDTPGILVMDVDATLIDEEVIDLLGYKAGVGKDMESITARAMRGEINFDESLKKRVSMLKNMDSNSFDEIRKKIHVTKGAEELIYILHSHGWKIGAVSGGFHEVIDPLLYSISIDFWAANHLEVVNGKLTGKVLGDIVNRNYKAEMLCKWARNNNISMKNTVAVGDGANDISMLNTARLGIAFCAKDAVKKQVSHSIDIRDLKEVLRFLES